MGKLRRDFVVGGSICVFVFGCGSTGGGSGGSGGAAGSGASGGTGGAGASGGSAGAGGSGGASGTGGASASGGAGGVACADLESEVLASLASAQECCPECDSIQCEWSLPGICCRESVNVEPDSAEALAYVALLESCKNQNCCTCNSTAPCPSPPSRSCPFGDGAPARCAPF